MWAPQTLIIHSEIIPLHGIATNVQNQSSLLTTAEKAAEEVQHAVEGNFKSLRPIVLYTGTDEHKSVSLLIYSDDSLVGIKPFYACRLFSFETSAIACADAATATALFHCHAYEYIFYNIYI